jgi:hypothetical protein
VIVVTALVVISGALVALPVLLLIAFTVGPILLVPVLVVAICVPVLIVVGALTRYVDRS